VLDQAAFAQTAAECSDEVRGILRRPGTHEPDNRDRRLLRPRRERPRRREALWTGAALYDGKGALWEL